MKRKLAKKKQRKMGKLNFISRSFSSANVPNKDDDFVKEFGQFRLNFSNQYYPVQDIISDHNLLDLNTGSIEIAAGSVSHLGMHRSERYARVTQFHSSGPIDRSAINENLKKQFEELTKSIKEDKNELLYWKMNINTKNKLKTFYSYEVNFIPKNLSDEDLKVGKIVGSIHGIKIVLDDTLENFVIVPLIRASYSKMLTMNKTKFISQKKESSHE
jgi:hypothetical protein